MVFGEYEDITSQINNNLTNTAPYPEYQQNEDGFLYIILNPSNQWFQISIDSVSMLPNGPSGGYYYPNSLSNMSLLIPLKKDYYWTFSAYQTSINKAFWIPLESGGGSSTNTSNFSYTNQAGETYAQNVSQGELFYLDGTFSFGQSDYFVVPPGKNLYIDYSVGSCETMEVYRNNILFDRLDILSKLDEIILTEGDSIVFGWITDPNCSSFSVNYLIYGYLVDVETLINPLLVDITNNSYTVPAGKKLFVMETFNNFNAGFVTFPNGNISNMAYGFIQEMDFLESGTNIEVDPNSLCTPCFGYSYISGYLLND
jgi:hypothetical protein